MLPSWFVEAIRSQPIYSGNFMIFDRLNNGHINKIHFSSQSIGLSPIMFHPSSSDLTFSTLISSKYLSNTASLSMANGGEQ